MRNLIHICLDLPADAIFEQVIDEYSGRVISTTIEADLNIGEINMGLAEFEAALKEYAWGDEEDGS